MVDAMSNASSPKKRILSPIEIGKLYAEYSTLPDEIQLDPVKASEVLTVMGIRIAPQTLAKFRCTSTRGPEYKKVANGRVVYTLGALRAFAGVAA